MDELRLLPIDCYRMWQWQFGLYVLQLALCCISAMIGPVTIGFVATTTDDVEGIIIATLVVFFVFIVDYCFRCFSIYLRRDWSLTRRRRKYYRTSQTYKTIRTSFAVGYFVSALVLCYLVNYFPRLANISPGAQDDWVPVVARMLATICSCLFLGLALLHFMAATIGILASKEKSTTWSYSRGGSLKEVNFRDLVHRRTRLEQASGYYPESSPLRQSTAHGVSVHAPQAKVLSMQHQRLPSSLPQAPEQRHDTTLFVRCGCCLDTNDLIPLLPPVRPTYFARIANRRPRYEAIELKVVAWARQREQALRSRVQSSDTF